jgi:hypothetical protein
MYVLVHHDSNLNMLLFDSVLLYGTDTSVQFAVWTGADWALIDVTHKCCTHLLSIHDQEMIKGSAASDLAICKSEVHIFRAQLVDISNNVIH